MASPAQIVSNQQNAQSSTGPRTPEGKRQSSLNSLRHGLTGQTVILPGEDTQAYAAFRDKVFHDFAPHESQEEILVQTICDTQWRLERARNMEASLTTLALHEEIPPQLAAIEDPSVRQGLVAAYGYDKREKKIRNLQLQEYRLQRTLFKAIDDLRAAQALRRATQQSRLAEAVDTRIACRKTDLPFNSAQLGFDFTDDQLDREEIRRAIASNRKSQPIYATPTQL